MFVPGWLLFLLIVALFLVSGTFRAAVAKLFGFAFAVFRFIVLAFSLGFGIYFLRENEYVNAFLAGAPCLAFMAWRATVAATTVYESSGRFNVTALRLLIGLHRARLRLPMGPTALVKAGLALATRVRLGWTLFTFYNTIRHFPLFYEVSVKAPDGSPWRSVAIPSDDIALVSEEELEAMDLDLGSECIAYRFTASEQDYGFYAHPVELTGWTNLVGDVNTAYKAYVVEVQSGLMLLELTFFASLNGRTEHYRQDHIESLRPGPWLAALYEVADRVRSEAFIEEHEAMQTREAERAKRFA